MVTKNVSTGRDSCADLFYIIWIPLHSEFQGHRPAVLVHSWEAAFAAFRGGARSQLHRFQATIYPFLRHGAFYERHNIPMGVFVRAAAASFCRSYALDTY